MIKGTRKRAWWKTWKCLNHPNRSYWMLLNHNLPRDRLMRESESHGTSRGRALSDHCQRITIARDRLAKTILAEAYPPACQDRAQDEITMNQYRKTRRDASDCRLFDGFCSGSQGIENQDGRACYACQFCKSTSRLQPERWPI